MTGKKNVGRRRSLILSRNFILRCMEACTIEFPTADQIARFLRSQYPFYSRYKLQLLTKEVKKTLKFNEDYYEEEATDHEEMKKGNSKEERLQQLKKMISSEDSTASAASDDDDEEELSASEDRICGEKFEPECDLMKDMLRQIYIQKAVEEIAREDNVELEVMNNNDSKLNKKVDLLRGGNQRRWKLKLDSRKRKGGREGSSSADNVNYGPKLKDFGGMNGMIEELIMEVIAPFYQKRGRPMPGILLHGPPGCGKTTLALAIANATSVPFYKISSTGVSEENIRELFSKAYRTAPSIVFIDEIDAVASKRENLQRVMDIRIVTELIACMNGIAYSENSYGEPGYILVIGATNRPDALDPAVRRRFHREILLGVPDEKARVDILSKLTKKRKIEGDLDLVKIARCTPGFVGSDLEALTYEACNLPEKRIFCQRKIDLARQPVDVEHAEEWWKQPFSQEENEKLNPTTADFEVAVKQVQPSSKREGFSTIPNVKWEFIGGHQKLRQVFYRFIVGPIKDPESYANVRLEAGFLLYGPPGCGKTLIAKAVANEAGANFIHVKGPEILNKYVGESELAVRKMFSRARTCSPCIIFFDEMDALIPARGREGGWVVERLLNQLLVELDGADERRGVFVIGATNRPEIVDRAVLRPGRLKLLYVPLPSPHERGLILKALARKWSIDFSVNLMEIAADSSCEHFSGADLAGVVNDVAMDAVHDKLTSVDILLKQALEKNKPSVDRKQRYRYKLLLKQFGGG